MSEKIMNTIQNKVLPIATKIGIVSLLFIYCLE